MQGAQQDEGDLQDKRKRPTSDEDKANVYLDDDLRRRDKRKGMDDQEDTSSDTDNGRLLSQRTKVVKWRRIVNAEEVQAHAEEPHAEEEQAQDAPE